MGHSPVIGGLGSDMRGAVIDTLAVTFGASGAVTLVDNAKTGLLTVVKTATGRYTFTVATPTYCKLVGVLVTHHYAAATDATRQFRVLQSTVTAYSSSSPTFEIDCVDATPVLADPISGSGFSLTLIFERLSTF